MTTMEQAPGAVRVVRLREAAGSAVARLFHREIRKAPREADG